MTIKDPILFDIPMPIRTPRLEIRTVYPGDGTAMQDMKVESWDDLCRWMPFTKEGVGTVDDAEKVIRQNYAKFILREDMMMIAKLKDGTPVGMCGLHRFDWEFRTFEIGYYVRKSLYRQGYATEIANALTRFGFGALSARRMTISAATDNMASRRVIEKLGYELESSVKADAFLPDGKVTGHANYVRYDMVGLPDLEVSW